MTDDMRPYPGERVSNLLMALCRERDKAISEDERSQIHALHAEVERMMTLPPAILLFRCGECDWRGEEGDIIKFRDPMLEDNYWNICPRCRAAEQFVNMCDEPGCEREATCGWSSDSGYRRTCGSHSNWGQKK